MGFPGLQLSFSCQSLTSRGKLFGIYKDPWPAISGGSILSGVVLKKATFNAICDADVEPTGGLTLQDIEGVHRCTKRNGGRYWI